MTTSQATVNDRREIFGWAMYDWANSAFSTTVVTAFLFGSTHTSPFLYPPPFCFKSLFSLS